jgi:RND family efflux transporter MFP subunit
MRRVWWGGLGIGVLVAGLAFAHGGEAHDEPPAAAPAVAASKAPEAIGAPVYIAKESQFLFGVRTQPAAERELRGRVSVLGRLVPRSDGAASLYPPQAGLLLSPPGRALPLPGTPVKKGELLAVLEGALAAPERVGLAASKVEAGARVSAASARLAAAEREVTRLEGLSGVVSERDLAAARTERDIARAELEGAQRAEGVTLRAGGANRYELRAPIDGVVASVGAVSGSQVSSERPIFQLVDAGTLWAEARIFESDLPKVQGASEAILRPEGLGDAQFPGKLISLGLVIDEQARTVPALVEAQNPEGLLRVGMFVRVDLLAGENLRALTVPKRAVLEQAGRTLVYVHTAPEFFEARAVSLGSDDGASVAVLRGLLPGDRVVTDGLAAVRIAAGGR